MTTTKLTPAQRRVLAAMRDGAELRGYELSLSGVWHYYLTEPRETVAASTVQALLVRGYIEQHRDPASSGFGIAYRPTPAGIAALEGAEAEREAKGG
jgi:hypothetical protein